MAAPTFVAASTGATDAGGAWSYTTAAPGASGRLIIVQVLQDGVSADTAISITSATNCTDLSGTANLFTALSGVGRGVGSGPNGYQYLFFARSTGTSAIVITGANSGADDIYIRAYEFADVNTGTTEASILEGLGNSGTTSTTLLDQGVTTTANDRLALNFIAITDDASGLASFAGETGGDWTLATAIYETATGTDGTLGLMTAAMPSAGTINGGSATIVSLPWGVIGFALIGTVFIPRNPAVDHMNPGVLMKGIREAWHRRRSGIFVPDLWTPEGALA